VSDIFLAFNNCMVKSVNKKQRCKKRVMPISNIVTSVIFRAVYYLFIQNHHVNVRDGRIYTLVNFIAHRMFRYH